MKDTDPQTPRSVRVGIKIAKTMTKILIHEYCLFKNAMDPFLIASERLLTFSSETFIDNILFAK